MSKFIIIPLILCAMLFCGCRTTTLQSFQTGETIRLRTHSLTRKIWAHMPDGEVLQGTFAVVSSDSVGFSFGSATAFSGGQSATAFGNSTSYNVGGPAVVYALLHSTKPGSHLMLEVIANFSQMSGHGFGRGRTNDGREYKMVF